MTPDPYRCLAMAVMLHALKDATCGAPKLERDAIQWLSDDGMCWAEALGLEERMERWWANQQTRKNWVGIDKIIDAIY